MNQKTVDPKIYLPITRIDEEQRMVYGYGTREDLKDSYGTIIDLASVKRCIPDYEKYRNIREMHEMSAVGRADEITVDEKGVYLGVKIVDDSAWNKVKEKVYRGFSIGGKKDKQEDDRIFLRSITEFSLVDRPSNEGCDIDEFRIYGGEKDMEKIIEVKAEDGKIFRIAYMPPAEGEDVLKDIKNINVLRVEGAENVVDPPAKADIADIKRYIGEEAYDASTALSALTSVIYLLAKEASEGPQNEAGQVADLQVVVQKLKSFIASEIMETGSDLTQNSPMVLYAMGRLDDVFRKGSRHNDADMKSIQAIHDHTVSLGVDCGGTVEKAATADIQRAADLETLCVAAGEEITRIKQDYADLSTLGTTAIEEINRLKAEPVQRKGPLNSLVPRDGKEGEVQEGLTRIEDSSGLGVLIRTEDKADYEAAVKGGDQMRAALILMKAQHLQPMRATV
jgi:hypothetical protein